jgi:hypothetical protein
LDQAGGVERGETHIQEEVVAAADTSGGWFLTLT